LHHNSTGIGSPCHEFLWAGSQANKRNAKDERNQDRGDLTCWIAEPISSMDGLAVFNVAAAGLG